MVMALRRGRGSGESAGAKGILEMIFDPVYYLIQNADVAEAGLDPLSHFRTSGFGEGRDPSAFFSLSQARILTGSAAEIADADVALTEFCDAISGRSLEGPSSLVSPRWISIQLGLEDGHTFTDLLKQPTPADGFLPHPALLFRCLPKESATTVGEALKQLSTVDLEKHSLLDLALYRDQHRDLKNSSRTDREIFDHLWSEGIYQNRLKYLGGSAPRWAPRELIYRSSIVLIVKDFLRERVLCEGELLHEIPRGTATFIESDGQDLQALMEYSGEKLQSCPTMPSLLRSFGSVMESADKIVVPFVGPATFRRVPTNEALLDRDLLAGRQATTTRVVYAVVLNDYDDCPVPPDLPDCSYYLITDKDRIPLDLPWQVVRPTLAERDIKRLCLWYKTHPHRLFPHSEFAVWLDGNVECLHGSNRILQAHETLSEVATFLHPDRSCVFDEGAAILDLELDKHDTVRRVLEKLEAEGMPRNFGLYETNVLFSRTRDFGVNQMFDAWWRAIALGSRRDQMSFTYSAWSSGVEIAPLDGLSSTKNSRYFSKRDHASKKGRFV
jgi:hypothetical protein